MTDAARLKKQVPEKAECAAMPQSEEATFNSDGAADMYAKMANLSGLLEIFVTGSQHFRADGLFTPHEQEVVLSAISRYDALTYMMATHGMLGEKTSRVPTGAPSTTQLGAALPDKQLEDLRTFTQILIAQRGIPTKAQLRSFFAAGYGERQVLGIILAIVVMTLSNYTNRLFNTQLYAPFESDDSSG